MSIYTQVNSGEVTVESGVLGGELTSFVLGVCHECLLHGFRRHYFVFFLWRSLLRGYLCDVLQHLDHRNVAKSLGD